MKKRRLPSFGISCIIIKPSNLLDRFLKATNSPSLHLNKKGGVYLNEFCTAIPKMFGPEAIEKFPLRVDSGEYEDITITADRISMQIYWFRISDALVWEYDYRQGKSGYRPEKKVEVPVIFLGVKKSTTQKGENK